MFFYYNDIYIKGTLREYNMKNILAENMIRFGTKNISENDLKNILTESTLKDLDPLMANAQKYFAASWSKRVVGPQFSTANLIYVARNEGPIENDSKYLINIYKATVVNFGQINFIAPAMMGFVDYFNTSGLTDSGDLGITVSTEQKQPDVKSIATELNKQWNIILPKVAIDHLNLRKAKLAPAITAIKASPTFTTLGPLLTGTAKSVYDMIAAS